MATYVVGDVQGCFQPLQKLLEKICFDPSVDRLISVGDLVNRGPQNLQVLRFCKDLGSSFEMVLGNHDLHLLAIAEGVRSSSKKDTLGDVLQAHDAEALLQWLRSQPLLLEIDGFHIVHAGIPSIWSIEQAYQLANEVTAVIQSDRRRLYFEAMYGDTPNTWRENLQGPERWRLITNYLTRMRFCTGEGTLELQTKDSTQISAPYKPWFDHQRQGDDVPVKIIFGHWAALQGRHCGEHLFALDTGCVWGGAMRAMRLDTQEYFHQPSDC